MALVSRQPPCWYISGTRFANRRISTGLSAAISPPKINPTSIWKGFPCVTLGTRVSVDTKRESMVLERPFLMSNSSIGDKQFVGGLSNLTGNPLNNRSPWKASNRWRISSPLTVFIFLVPGISAASHNSFRARFVTPEKLFSKKWFKFKSFDSAIIRCN